MINENRREILNLFCSFKNKYLVYVQQSVGKKSRDCFVNWNGKLIFISRLIAYFISETPTLNQLGDILSEQINYCLAKGSEKGRDPKYKVLAVFYISQAQLACQLLVDLANLSGGDL